MDFFKIINKYYPNRKARDILIQHSRSVADKVLEITQNHPELGMDTVFLEEGAMVHDIGIFLTHAPAIGCGGEAPYLCHGYLGADLMRQEEKVFCNLPKSKSSQSSW